MLFRRRLHDYLLAWKERSNRKPLVIRGARQVGKSTLVKQFGESYQQFISINLEKKEYARLFKELDNTKQLLDAIYLQTGHRKEKGETLLFIDEIQEVPAAVQQLRYFFEEYPALHVIAAGSLLEFVLGEVQAFPVGRVEQVVLHPLDFKEFLQATDQLALVEKLDEIPVASFAHNKLLEQFHLFAMIGGMPEVVRQYNEDDSIANLPMLFENLWQSYKDDVEKYAKDQKERHLIRYLMQKAPSITDRINFSQFAQNQYSARAVSEAFRALDLARIIQLVYPTTQLSSPAMSNHSRRPRLQFLDTGLMNFIQGNLKELVTISDLHSFRKGAVIQHLVTQELKAQFHSPLYRTMFWVRENSNSNAEVDLVYQSNPYLIPIEIKAGKQGRLRSLHQFIERTNHPYAFRLLNNKFSKEEVTTPSGTDYQLFNLPYYLGSQLPRYIDWVMNEKI